MPFDALIKLIERKYNMDKIKVEFFHDVICSFCFPMSYRMRQLLNKIDNIEIVHRSFALIREPSDFDRMFGSRVAAKEEIIKHWTQANENDDLHRFNISGMEKENFLFPTSMNGLIACKAGYLTAGEIGYWDVFDALQHALFVQNKNIEELDVIEECVKSTDVEFNLWKQHYLDKCTMEAVEMDLTLAANYGVNSVPCLIVDGKYKISGAQPLLRIVEAINKINNLKETEEIADPTCSLNGNKMNCD
jgi:predicted DsbA family dithiol-disulfide isomerase